MYFKKSLQPHPLHIGWLIVILLAMSFVGNIAPMLSKAAGITPTATPNVTDTPIVATDTPIVPATDTPVIATDTPVVATDTPVVPGTDTPTPVGSVGGGGGDDDDDDDDDNNPTPPPPAPTEVISPTSTITPTGTIPSTLPDTGQDGGISTSLWVGLGLIMILIAGLIALKPSAITQTDDF